MKQLPLIITRDLRRLWNAALGLANGTIPYLLLYGPSGAGKSEFFRRLVAHLHWPWAAWKYVENLGDSRYRTFDLDEVLDIAREAGLVDTKTEARARDLLRTSSDLSGGREIGPLSVREVLDHLAKRLGRPEADVLLIWRKSIFQEEVKGRFPVDICAEVRDTPNELWRKIWRSLGQHARPTTAFSRRLLVSDFLRTCPCVVLVDEADLLEAESIHALRGLCDYTRTPMLLAGTERLRARLQRDPRLWTLATRIATVVELRTLTLTDLQESFPSVDSTVTMALWNAGRQNFRIINSILGRIEEMRVENPGLRLTRRTVEAAALLVLSSRPVPKDEDEAEAEAEQEAVAIAVGAVAGRRNALASRGERRPRTSARAVG